MVCYISGRDGVFVWGEYDLQKALSERGIFVEYVISGGYQPLTISLTEHGVYVTEKTSWATFELCLGYQSLLATRTYQYFKMAEMGVHLPYWGTSFKSNSNWGSMFQSWHICFKKHRPSLRHNKRSLHKSKFIVFAFYLEILLAISFHICLFCIDSFEEYLLLE